MNTITQLENNLSDANFFDFSVPMLPPMEDYYHPPPTTFYSTLCSPSGGGATLQEMMFRVAAMQSVDVDSVQQRAPKRRNVRISTDPQSVAARLRRERISERLRVLQGLIPGGTKMDTASMLEEAIHYVKFLKKHVQSLEMATSVGGGFSPVAYYSSHC